MRQRPLGSTGFTVSELGFGCGAVGGLMTRGEPDEQRAAVARALDAGVTYFDTAPMYGNGASEQNIGRVLSELNAWDRVTLGTKVMLTRDHASDIAGALHASLQQSLQRLGRDSVDLLQLHSRIVDDGSETGLTSSEVTDAVAAAMQSVISDGLVSKAGITGLGSTSAVHAVINSGRFDTVQAYFNALNPSSGFAGKSGGAQDFAGVIDTAARANMGVICIRALAAGAVSGTAERARYASPMDAAGAAVAQGGEFTTDVARAQKLEAIARELGLESTTELGFRFVLAKDGISTALIGFSDIGQLEAALRWVERGPLDAAAVARVVDAAS